MNEKEFIPWLIGVLKTFDVFAKGNVSEYIELKSLIQGQLQEAHCAMIEDGKFS